MNKNIFKRWSIGLVVSLGLFTLILTSCDSYMDAGVYRTSTTKMMDEYMASDSSDLDLFL